jgi:glycosyltransferase involved in cell wall biosynthesis
VPGLNVHLYQSPFRHESRILKITETLRRAGTFDAITIFATSDGLPPETETLDSVRQVYRISGRARTWLSGNLGKVASTVEWTFRIGWFLRREKVACVNSHSLSVLPLGVALKFLKKCSLIYDTHELETETVGSKGLRRSLAKFTERRLIGWADAVIVVNESIAGWYRTEYDLKNVFVVRNFPPRQEEDPVPNRMLRETFEIDDRSVVLLYHGLLSRHRGIERLLDAVREIPYIDMVFMGYGVLTDLVASYVKEYPNIHLLPAVPPDEVVRYACGADVGIIVIDNVCLSYYFALGNKIFEYLQAGLPVILSDFPEYKRLVDAESCGWTIPPSHESLLELLQSLTLADVHEKRPSAVRAGRIHVWESEEGTLLDAYAHCGLVPC